MTLANCIRYQKNINFWANFFLVAAIFCAASFLIDSEISLLIGIIGTILSVTIWLSLLVFKKYYQLYEKVFIAFQDLPPLASWTIAAADWESYQLVEKETRKRGYLKYILWSPVIMALIALSIYGEIDELDFDVNLIWYSLIGYTFLMLILYIQMRVGLNKTSHTGDHVIKLKTVGAQIDDSITYWGKFVADEHSTLGQALKSLLFAKSDKESKVNKAYLHQEGSYQYVVINFSLSEDHSSDLYLPITEEASTAIKEKLPQLQSAYLFNGEKQSSPNASTKKYNTKKYIKWMMAGAVTVSVIAWIVEKGWPAYTEWNANKYFEQGLTFQNNGNDQEAMVNYRKAIQENDEMPEPYLNIGVIYLNASDNDSALYYFDKALEVSPDYDLALFNKSKAYYSLQDYTNTVATLLNYERVAPDSHDHDLFMGDSFNSLNKPDTALFYYQRAYTENKKSAALCYLIGSILVNQLQQESAIPYFEESISMDETFADSYTSLGNIYESLNQTEKANFYFTKAEELKK